MSIEPRPGRIPKLILIVPPLLATACWCWARIAIIHFQRESGVVHLWQTAKAGTYQFWSLSLPFWSANALVVVSCGLIALRWPRRRLALLGCVTYALGVLLVAKLAFAVLQHEAFWDYESYP